MPKVFLSHNKADKSVVERIALVLRDVLGQENVFYDSWSIQPGDGIIDKMNRGLAECDYFLFFISKNSLSSEMVKMEWQNALISEAKEGMRFIPVRLDDCEIPTILVQKLYIDIFRNGIDSGIRQILDVVNGGNTYRESDRPFHNLKAYARTAVDDGTNEVTIEVRAESYMEPISRYLVMVGNPHAKVTCTSDNFVSQGETGTAKGNNGEQLYIHSIGTARATSPGFPFRISIRDSEAVRICGMMHAISENEYEHVPILVVLQNDVYHFGHDVLISLDEVLGKSQAEQVEYVTRQIENEG